MVKKVFYFILAIIVLMAIYLSIFEILLHIFQSPFGDDVSQNENHNAIWVYLLQQQYESFIDLDQLNIHEKRHLLDVKRILEKVYTIWTILMPIGTLLFIMFFKKLISSIFISTLVINLLIFSLFSYNFLVSFDLFHAMLFTGNSWKFPDDSLLIQIFPLNYFQEFLILFLLISFVTIGAIYCLRKV
jgi:uncharacterized membrane protein